MKVTIEFSITAQISSTPDKWMKFGIAPQEVEVKTIQELRGKGAMVVDETIEMFKEAGVKVNANL